MELHRTSLAFAQHGSFASTTNHWSVPRHTTPASMGSAVAVRTFSCWCAYPPHHQTQTSQPMAARFATHFSRTAGLQLACMELLRATGSKGEPKMRPTTVPLPALLNHVPKSQLVFSTSQVVFSHLHPLKVHNLIVVGFFEPGKAHASPPPRPRPL